MRRLDCDRAALKINHLKVHMCIHTLARTHALLHDTPKNLQEVVARRDLYVLRLKQQACKQQTLKVKIKQAPPQSLLNKPHRDNTISIREVCRGCQERSVCTTVKREGV